MPSLQRWLLVYRGSMRILAIGKKHDTSLVAAIEDYQKRLRPPFAVAWELLPYSSKRDDDARRDESRALLQKISPRDYVILLDETGVQYDSPALARTLESVVSRQSVVLVIGGAYGVDAELKRRANMIWSLSKLVFPHMLVRLLLIEQLYRAQEICRGGPYHHV